MKDLIYVVEDDKNLNNLITYNIKKENFSVKSFYRGIDVLLAVKKEKPDLIVLDLNLPDIDGVYVAKLLKSDSETKNIPIIMLTTKSSETDKIVVGLKVGADYILTKPFSVKELIIRIKNLLERYKYLKKNNLIRINDLKIFPDNFEVKINNKNIKLTTSEFKILLHLIKNEGKVLPRDYLLKNVLNSTADESSRVIDVHIRRLRNKLGKYGKYIKTVRNIGYKFEISD